MYSSRVASLKKLYKVLEKENTLYKRSEKEKSLATSKVANIESLASAISELEKIIMTEEASWRRGVLNLFEERIKEFLGFVYPEDFYSVSLSAEIYRGRIHVSATVSSPYLGELDASIDTAQGCLFQQIVSFAALMCVMELLGVNTVYVDEAFSGVSVDNIAPINRLLKEFENRNFNLILIVQNISMADGIQANKLILNRSVDNKTTIRSDGSESY